MNYVYIMQGVPGSGKSTAAKRIANISGGYGLSVETCSADDYHMVGDKYDWKPENVGKAHKSCQNKFLQALKNNVNFVIVDNTNVRERDVQLYLDMAHEYGYLTTIIRPDTPWSEDATECYKKNTHSVPLETIEKMLNSIKNFDVNKLSEKVEVWYI